MAFVDLPSACILLAFAMVSLIAPSAFHRWDVRNSGRRQRAYSAFAAEFLDAVQGLATLKAFGQGAERGRLLAARAARRVPRHDVGARHQHPHPWYHRHRDRSGSGGGARIRGAPGERGRHGAQRPAHRADDGYRSVPPPARAARAPAPGNDRPVRRPGHRAGSRCGACGRTQSRGLESGVDVPDAAFPERGLHLSRRSPARPPRPRLQRRAGRTSGLRGRERRRQDHHRTSAHALLRSRCRCGVRGGTRPAHPASRGPPSPDCGGEPGHLPLPRDGRGQPASGKARCDHGRAGGGRARRQRPRVHRAPASRVRHGGGGAGHPSLRRAAPACRHRPGPAARCADTYPRRGAFGSGRAERSGDPGGARPSHAGTHQSHLRSPAVERDRGGSHSRPRWHRHRGIRHAPRADGEARPLPCADVGAGRGRRERGRGNTRRG